MAGKTGGKKREKKKMKRRFIRKNPNTNSGQIISQ